MSTISIALPQSLTVYQLETLLEPWKELFQQSESSFSIDISPLTEIDAAGFQLLLSAIKNKRERVNIFFNQDSLNETQEWLLEQLSQSCVCSEVE